MDQNQYTPYPNMQNHGQYPQMSQGMMAMPNMQQVNPNIIQQFNPLNQMGAGIQGGQQSNNSSPMQQQPGFDQNSNGPNLSPGAGGNQNIQNLRMMQQPGMDQAMFLHQQQQQQFAMQAMIN